MQRLVSKVWKPSPLPVRFHVGLESGNWIEALQAYYSHQFHAPPVDTFELLKTIMFKTGIKVEDIQHRFDSKIKIRFGTNRKVIDQVEWGAFWHALNNGDSKTISQALDGARIHGVQAQTGVAEACAVLLKSQKDWHRSLIDEVPFGAVTKNNLMTLAFERGRWDVAIELLHHATFGRGDIMNVWPLVQQLPWVVGLMFVSQCSRQAVSFDIVLPELLKRGCHLQLLAEHLERANCLNDPGVIAPLLSHAVATKEWDFVSRAVEHLHDLGVVSSAAHRVFCHLCRSYGTAHIVGRLTLANVPLHAMTIEALEELVVAK